MIWASPVRVHARLIANVAPKLRTSLRPNSDEPRTPAAQCDLFHGAAGRVVWTSHVLQILAEAKPERAGRIALDADEQEFMSIAKPLDCRRWAYGARRRYGFLVPLERWRALPASTYDARAWAALREPPEELCPWTDNCIVLKDPDALLTEVGNFRDKPAQMRAFNRGFVHAGNENM
jgi:hypothetical protein